MAKRIIVYMLEGDSREFEDADSAERIVDTSNRWGLTVGCLAVLKGNELQKAYKSAEWLWYERHVDREPEPNQFVAIPRRDGDITHVPGNRWQVIETVTDRRGPYKSWVIYRDKDIRAVFRHSEVTLDRSPWAAEADA
jgi:hypothetical protein